LVYQTASMPSSEQEFVSSANDAITETSHKPDIILTGKGKKGSTFAQVCAVIEVKYTSGIAYHKYAIYAFADKSWFILDACDQRVHTIGGALCSSIFTPCISDHGGFLCSEDVNIEISPLSFLQCFTSMAIKRRRAAGHDQE
jgi:hypothetical protein